MKSDVEEFMPRLLPVEPCADEQYDVNEPPRNPQEYLRHVQREASLCPDVVVAQIDPKKLRQKQSVSISFTGCRAAPQGFSPSLKWQQQQVSRFSEVRQSVAKNQQHWKTQFLDDNVVMPRPDDEDGWKKFCLGENVFLSTTSNEGDTGNPGLDYVKVGFPPFLSIMSKLNQSTISVVLEYLINWFEERDFVPQLVSVVKPFHLHNNVQGGKWKFESLPPQGRWLYALLACLEKPLLPEAHSLIRQLARRCSAVRANLENKDDERLSALNLMICIVARYFNQNDLADKD